MIRSIHFIEDACLWLSVRAGELAIRQRSGAYVHLSNRIRVIVAAGHGFAVTGAAIRHCSAKHIELFVSDDAATFISLFASASAVNSSRTALRIRERQFRMAFNPRKSAAIARAIVATKVKAERHRYETERALVAELKRARTTDDVRHIEAKAAQIWWQQWAGFKILFTGAGVPLSGAG
jgi:CRISPR/Cas system-associated endonuclease Cas1